MVEFIENVKGGRIELKYGKDQSNHHDSLLAAR